MLDPCDREAVLAYNALKKADYRVIIELSCIPSSEVLLGIKRAYQARYRHSLEEDVASHFSGEMRTVSSWNLSNDLSIIVSCCEHIFIAVSIQHCAAATSAS